MANVIHHPRTEPMDVPSRVYWAAGIGLALLILLFAYFSMSSPNQVGAVTPLLTDPALPFVPFIPVL